jgi:Domain of unknown function (DUF4082)/Bacterial Ig-like domain
MASTATWPFSTPAEADCPCSLFSTATVPTITSAQDGGAYELGVRFVPGRSGHVTGVRFYKGVGNTGTHTGSLWSASGTRLATGTFTAETATGWQTLTFAEPVLVIPGATYTASYTAPNGHYAIDHHYFETTKVDSTPLTAPQTSYDTPNGVFQPGSGYPTLSHEGNNYWVDVDYTPNNDNTPPAHTGHTPLSDAVDVPSDTDVTASFDEPIDLTYTTFTVTNGETPTPGTTTLSPDGHTVIWTPTTPLPPNTRLTATIRASDHLGNQNPTPQTWTFTTTPTPTSPPTPTP